MKYYTVYLTEDESVIAFGSIKDIAHMMKRSESSVRSMICRSKNGENKKYEVNIEDCKVYSA